jgi:stage II sporulation protein D
LTAKLGNGEKDIFPTYYSAVCGGHTENAGNVFGGQNIQPLKGVPCPYCKQVAKPKSFSWPRVEFDKDKASKKLLRNYPSLSKLGDVNEIIISNKSTYEENTRITKVKLIGSNGKFDFLRAEDLRLTLDPSGSRFKSTMCKFKSLPEKWVFYDGKGWGHGVGLCQCGAQAMARKGKKAKQILYYYYPSAKVTEIY